MSALQGLLEYGRTVGIFGIVISWVSVKRGIPMTLDHESLSKPTPFIAPTLEPTNLTCIYTFLGV